MNNQNVFVANRYSSISCIKDQSIATCADVTRLLLMFENLRLALAKKRCEWECNIGVIHVFSCINICRVPRMLFEHEADKPSVQHHPRDPASVSALKQTCVIVILAYFTLFQPNSH